MTLEDSEKLKTIYHSMLECAKHHSETVNALKCAVNHMIYAHNAELEATQLMIDHIELCVNKGYKPV